MSHLKHIRARPPRGAARRPAPAPALIFVLLPVLLQAPAARGELYFNPRFLSDDPAAVSDLSRFEKGQEVPPGVYRTDIYLNDGFVTTRDVRFMPDGAGPGIAPCLTREQLAGMGVNVGAVPAAAALAPAACAPLAQLFGGATARFDAGQQRLYISVPQLFMGSRARGYIPPEQWDSGITAGLLNYSFSGNSVRSRAGGDSSYAYLSLQSGLNAGPWRLRDSSNWSHSTGAGGGRNRWQHVNTWLERDIVPLRSRLTLGDGYTGGDIFSGVNFRGAQLASDDNMLPESEKGFAPVVRGIAGSTAEVTIRQNGYEIYHTTVPPGPFAIGDLYASGGGGDLQVTVKEAGGGTRTFSVPWSTVPLLQREGHTRYSVTAGTYRSGNAQQESPGFAEATLLRGLPGGWTLYGGAQLADRYRAFNLGAGKNMGVLGAISADVTQADATLADGTDHQGQSLRFLYNKSLTATGTNVQLAGYRYSTQGYYSLADTAYSRMSGHSVQTQDGVLQIKPRFTDYYNLAYSRRGRLQLSVTQQLGHRATLYLSGSRQTYWNSDRSDEQLQAGVSAAVSDISMTLSYSMTRNAWQDGRDRLLSFSMSVPFSHWMRSDSRSPWRHASASASASHDQSGRTTGLTGLYGTLLDDNNLSYSVQTGYAGGGEGEEAATGNASLNYRGGYGNVNAGYSHSEGLSQLYYGFSGGVVAHENGVTLSQPLNGTVVLVRAPGAGSVKVENQTGVRTDWRGYAVLPYATEYRENRVALNTGSLADNVELEDPVATVVPTRGAVVRADFRAHVGLRLLMTLTYGGRPVPFGAMVAAGEGQSGGIVAENGQAYLTGMPLKGRVQVKWGAGPGESCVAEYRLPAGSREQPLSRVAARCR